MALTGSILSLSASGEIVYVNAPSGLNLRQIPSVNSRSMGILDYGQRVVVVDDEPGLNGWLRVEGDYYIWSGYTQRDDPLTKRGRGQEETI